MVAAALLALTAASWAFWLAALAAVRRHLSGPAPAAPSLPPVSLLKPVRGIDAGARECFESFLGLDYPEFELLFGVADPDDPVLPLLERLRAEHPRVAVRVLVVPAPGPNRKAHLLDALARVARAPVLVATDADIRVTPSWLRDVVGGLSAPGVGLVTCPYRGADARSLAARLEALYMGVTFLPSAVVAARLGVPFAMGSTMALRRADLDAIGGFAPLAEYLADDYQLGARVAALGRRVAVSGHVVESVLGATSFRDGWRREVRWSRCARAGRPAGHAGWAVTFATPLGAAALVASSFSAAGWVALGGSLAVRCAVAAGVARASGDESSLRALALLPLRDVLTAAVWVAALLGRRVVWRGEVYEVDREGRLHWPSPGAAPARAGGPTPPSGGAPAAGSRARPAAR